MPLVDHVKPPLPYTHTKKQKKTMHVCMCSQLLVFLLTAKTVLGWTTCNHLGSNLKCSQTISTLAYIDQSINLYNR